jgi:membrane-associated phospholipid phosphatase
VSAAAAEQLTRAMLKKWLTMVADAGTRRAAVFCAGLVLGWTGLARADDTEAAAPVGLQEYLTIPLLSASYLGVKLWPAAEGARWDSPILFDGGARKLLRLHSASGRKSAETVSNILLSAEVIHSVVIDPLLVAWGSHQSPSMAWRMSVINAQAYALTLVLNEATKRLTSRKRPFVDACDRDPTRASCASGSRYSSFYSGHAAVTATGAGLICAHHTQLNLYQSNVLDTGACSTAIAGTAITGAMRIVADNHWASDVLVGHLMGYLSGYLLPTLLYYKESRTAPHDHAPERPGVLALPIVTDHSLQLSLFGQF